MGAIDYEVLRGAVDVFEEGAKALASGAGGDAVCDLAGLFATASRGAGLVRDGNLARGIEGIGDCRLYETFARLAGGDPLTEIDEMHGVLAEAAAGRAPDPERCARAARTLGDIARRIRTGKSAW